MIRVIFSGLAERWYRTPILFIGLLLFTSGLFAAGSHETRNPRQSDTGIRIVAAENFYGDVAAQIAGSYGTVTNILTDPNVDPHEYESNVRNAQAVANARLVIENGGGYDDWMDRLTSASPDPARIVLKGFDIAPTHLPENEHVFYGIENMRAIAGSITEALKQIDPEHAGEFETNFQTFSTSLLSVTRLMNEIKSHYQGVPVALTETIFLYQAIPMGLRVITPFAFQKAIAEGNDPPADAALAAQTQVKDKQARALIYNEQTVTRITSKLEQEARAVGTPVVPVTETMPPSLHYQSWMTKQLSELSAALGSSGKE